MYVEFEKSCVWVSAASMEELFVEVYLDAQVLTKPCFVPTVCESSNGDESVWGVVDDGNLSEDWSEVYEVSAFVFGVVAECDIEWAWPGLGLEVQGGSGCGIDDRDVGAAVCDTVQLLLGNCDGVCSGG